MRAEPRPAGLVEPVEGCQPCLLAQLEVDGGEVAPESRYVDDDGIRGILARLEPSLRDEDSESLGERLSGSGTPPHQSPLSSLAGT